MKIALQVILLAFMILYFGGAIGAKKDAERGFYLLAGSVLATAMIITVAIL